MDAAFHSSGLTKFKDTYAAGWEARAAWQRTQSAGVPEGWRDQLLREYPNSDPSYWPDSLIVNAQSREIEELRALLAAPAQPAAHDQGEVQRLREAMETDSRRQQELLAELRKRCSLPDWARSRIDAALAASTGQEVKL